MRGYAHDQARATITDQSGFEQAEGQAGPRSLNMDGDRVCDRNGLPEASCLYQYTRVMSGFPLPRPATYSNPVTEVFANTQLIRADLQARGTVSTESRSLPILVDQELSHPKLAASYAPGDVIQYKTGSAEAHGIASNSRATVIATDPTKNLLIIETREGEQVAYNPALLKQQTAQSTVYREETRDLAEGDRIQFTKANWEQRIRFGDFATVERIAEDNSIAVRLDSGRAAELNPEKARHIDYGYVVDGNQHFSADRVLATGENLESAALSKLSPYTRDLSVYTSDNTSIQPQQSILVKETSLIQAVESTLPGLESFGLSR